MPPQSRLAPSQIYGSLFGSLYVSVKAWYLQGQISRAFGLIYKTRLEVSLPQRVCF